MSNHASLDKENVLSRQSLQSGYKTSFDKGITVVHVSAHHE